MEIRERLEKGQLMGRAIIEMLGAPKEHIEQTLKDYIERIKQENSDIEIIKEEFDEATEQGKLFASFVELEIWFKNMASVMNFCMESMPSSIEILEPEKILMNTTDFSGMLNDLQGKVHKIDFSLKALHAENNILKKNNQALVKNIVVVCIRTGNDTIEKIVENTGIDEKHLKPVLDELIERGSIKKKGKKYLA